MFDEIDCYMRKPYLACTIVLALSTFSFSCKKSSENKGTDDPPPYELLFLRGDLNNNTQSGICRSTGGADNFTIIKAVGSGFTSDSFFSTALHSPQFGPNNEIIFLASFKDFAKEKPYSMNMSGSNIKKLTDEADANYFNINVSPKSGRMVCEREIRSLDQYQLISCNADGSNVKVIKTLQYGYTNWGFGGANWFPDGETILFSVQNGTNTDSPMELYSIKWDGTGEKKLSNTNDRLYLHMSVSPNGKKILYTQRKNGQYDVYVVNSDMSNNHEVTILYNNTTSYLNMNWSSDSRWFACRSLGNNLMLIDSEGDGSKSKVIAHSSTGGSIK